MITEIVTFRAKDTTSDEQLLLTAENLINGFQRKLDGYIDAELVQNTEDKSWGIIYHYDDLDKLKAAGALMRQSAEYAEFGPLVDAESVRITLYQHTGRW